MQQLPKYILTACAFLLLYTIANAQQSYWQQRADYKINVTLNDAEKTLDADETIIYTNNSPDTLQYLWFHLWMNAYKNDKTAFSEQLLRNNHTEFYFSNEAQRGYINRLEFKVNEEAAITIPDSNNTDIVKLLLPKPLPPKGTIIITTPFHVKLPYNFSRGGYEGQTFQLTQWYPKPAVYDAKGWHPMPYLDQGEFYSEFGNFDVTITVPSNFIVASSGVLQDNEELEQLRNIGKQDPEQQRNYTIWNNEFRLQAAKQKKFDEAMPASSLKKKTLRYVLNDAHDFAWFASKLFLIQYDTVQLASHSVDAFTFYNPWNKVAWQNSLQDVKSAVRFYSDKLGKYPYPVVSAVLGKSSKETGGMEYPTITLLEMSDGGKELDATLAHEIGHNWLYGILATNERDHAWMDEGINTYYEHRYINEKYIRQSSKKFPFRKFPVDSDSLSFATLAKLRKDQPIDIPSDSLTETNYGLSVYSKASWWLQLIEQQKGTANFDALMHHYYETWKFRHPKPEDFINILFVQDDSLTKADIKALQTTGFLTNPPKKRFKLTGFFNLKETDKYNYVAVAPAVGYNYYDKLMIGGLIHNYQLPLNNFNFLAVPLYATSSNSLNGAVRLSYSMFTKRNQLQFSVSGTRYNINEYTQRDGSKLYFTLNRIVPAVQYVLYNKDLRLTQRWTFQLKSFILSKNVFGDFKAIETPTDTFYIATKKNTATTIGRLKVSISDNRKLYPYDADITFDAGKTFLRAGFTGNYFFNYAQKNKGIQARFFAGKFIYLQQKTLLLKFDNSNYLLTLTGPHGEEDYTFSDFFIGRSEFDGGLSQQIMQRDGFFKVGTPFNSEPVGKTDDWLLSLNLSGDIPDNLNPLSVLPFRLPVQLFIDIGTYSDAWKEENSNGRFLYDAGIKVSVLKSAFSVYLPIIYSKVYSNYYKSFYPEKRFAHTIAFSFNLQQLQPNKLVRSFPL